MDTGNMTFGEILFNGRYHVIGGVMFLVFVAAFAREVIRELAATVTERRRVAHRHGMGVFVPDMMLGATMTDGGEPVEQEKQEKQEKKKDDTSSTQA